MLVQLKNRVHMKTCVRWTTIVVFRFQQQIRIMLAIDGHERNEVCINEIDELSCLDEH